MPSVVRTYPKGKLASLGPSTLSERQLLINWQPPYPITHTLQSTKPLKPKSCPNHSVVCTKKGLFEVSLEALVTIVL